MKRFGIGGRVGTEFVRVEVRAEEAGAVVVESEMGTRLLGRADGFRLVLAEGRTMLPLGGGRCAVLSGLNGGEWMGYFSVAHVKTIVGAVGDCIEVHNARMADQELEGFRAW